MLNPSNTVASAVRQTGLKDFGDAITGAKPEICPAPLQHTAQCEQAAAVSGREQLLADLVAIGCALFVAAVVGRIAVTFVALFTTCLRHQRAKLQVRTAARSRASQGGLLDG